ncbi:MAG TPA: LPS-assembly protein LptD [Rhodocyclaceae bacterium]|nr:LPS-assembly protein LptD [Rhodocyclaceae bacterium]
MLTLAVLACFAPLSQAESTSLRVDPRLVAAVQTPAAQTVTPAKVDTNKVTPESVPRDAKPNGQLTHIEADKIEGRNDVELRALGKVQLKRGDLQLDSDTLTYDQLGNEATAQGNVKLQREKDHVEGPRAKINLDTYVGEFDAPTYSFQRIDTSSSSTEVKPAVTGSGSADVLKLEGENQYQLTNATYSTCPAPSPDWYLKIRDLSLDYDRNQGNGKNATLVFKNVPIVYVPWMEFPLNGGRQSGLLPPTFGSSSNTGLDLTVPYYLNLAPNYDATIAPRWMGRRGTQLNGEFRYLTAHANGILAGEYLPDDQVAQKSRSLLSVKHNQDIGSGFSGVIDYTKVSDNDYFADLSSRITATSQATLNQQALLNYGNGSWFTGAINAQHYQTLTGASPYDRLPQITARANLPDVYGFALDMPSEYTQFRNSTLDEGKRTVLYPQVAYPVQTSAAYLTPKVGMHLSQYELDRRTSTGPDSISRAVPIMTVDSGLNFEREITVRDKAYTQTLEPRVYYVRVPFRNQDQIPVFDSALADFNFAQLFSENVFSGSDRIADANQVTAGVSSRFIESDTGVQWLQAAVGQRYYFSDQRVTLPGVAPRTGRIADWLGAVSGRVMDKVTIDTAYQYDPREHRSERATAGISYQPDFAKVVSASYRYQRNDPTVTDSGIRDLDISGQWPLWGGWYGVGRYERNLLDHRLTEAIAGLEYKADCWVLRTVWQTLINTKQLRNNAIFVQLEFNGLASLGSSPVQLLKRSIGGYGKINSEPGVGDPVFGGNADN